MTVYVDDMRRTATVRGLRRRWSHLIADTPEELREFGTRLGLSASWIQKAGTRTEHFDVTDSVRAKAIILGAEQISYTDLPVVTARLLGVRNPGEGTSVYGDHLGEAMYVRDGDSVVLKEN